MAAAISEWPPAAGEWPSNVEEILEKAKRAVSDVEVRVSMRVPKALVNSKAEAYNPQLVSLGPYHHFWSKDKSLEPAHHLSQLELYKLKKATERDPDFIKRLFTKISEDPMIFVFEQIYQRNIEEKDIPEFTWMMALDALFLSNFLCAFTSHSIMPAKESLVLCDIVKLENQIPIFLLTQVELDASVIKSQICSLCRACFQVGNPNIKIENEKHLLAHMHKCISSILQLQPEIVAEERTSRQRVLSGIDTIVSAVLGAFFSHHQDFLYKYNAKELRRGGIKFRSSGESSKIRFCKTSDTLYLPPIRILEHYSEVVLRNLLALEFNDYSGQQKNVTNYVELMDCLIDTPEDVALLRKSHVIYRQSTMITDEYVARMWDGMSNPVCLTTGFLDAPGGLKAQIKEALTKNYYRSLIRGCWDEFRTEYFPSPWKLAALMVGVFVLLLTMVQTFCSLKYCQRTEAAASATISAALGMCEN
ncbi:UPF0481 protein At3g47200-like [Cryptomeria japonica]|uniref:UPF0481 protein At3g47200-like n=1 Tax=Cryptomeria japonica TaxID=3369 RepID=UPI0027DA643D|nr:UPF0481 protein At3g47200-like [Cryptomeria japonica]